MAAIARAHALAQLGCESESFRRFSSGLPILTLLPVEFAWMSWPMDFGAVHLSMRRAARSFSLEFCSAWRRISYRSVFFTLRIRDGSPSVWREKSRGRRLTLLPPYVFHAYNVTHSLVVWAVAFFLLWQLVKKPPWLLGAWLLHILCDIPTHATSYFPTPFLWPFPTPFVNGVPWSTPWFMAANYGTMLIVYCGLFFYFRRKKTRSGSQ